jgi:hypothetical protein
MKDFTGSKLVLNAARLLLVVFAVGIALSSTINNSLAAQKSNRSAFAALPRPGSIHLSVSQRVFSGGGTHYLYVDDGTSPDSIDVYAVTSTITHVGNFRNNASRNTAYYGATTLAVARANATHGACLLLTDNNGFVDSFSIKARGGLSPEISHIADGGAPEDVAVAKSGNTAYVTTPGVDLESYSIGSGCVLTLLNTLSTTNQQYFSFALPSSTRLVAPDFNTGNIDTYALGSGGTITFLNSVAGQIGSPDSITLQTAQTASGTVTNVFTGQATGSAPQNQGSQYKKKKGSIAFLAGSPSSDPSGSNGAAVTFDSKDSLLIQGEQYTNTLGVYAVTPGVPGTPGSMSFKEQTPMAVSNESPLDFAQLGSTLFVNQTYNGDLEACTMSSSGISGCNTVATLTSINGIESGLALL